MSTTVSKSSTSQGTYIIVNDSMLRVKAIDLDGQKINMTASDHLVYQKLHHMHQQLKKAGKPCLPSKKWLSFQLCISERCVAKSLDKLKKVGLLDWKKTVRHGHVRNIYTVKSELMHKVYVADLKEPVELSRSDEAIRNRLDDLCGEAIDTPNNDRVKGYIVAGSGALGTTRSLHMILDDDDF